MWSRQSWKLKWTTECVNKRKTQLLPRATILSFSTATKYGGKEDASTPESSNRAGAAIERREENVIQRNNQSKKRSYGLARSVFSGIQPTGIPHLGNFLGALRQWKDLQDQKDHPNQKQKSNHQLYYSIVDLHSLTNLAKDSAAKRVQLTRESFASLLAIGLDPKKSVIFVQSHSTGFHAQLMWILSTVASTGYLSRMTQWKSKLGLGEEATLDDQSARDQLRLGLFSYPVLQAADILLYKADTVPIGEDQVQHVEFTRNLARSFNSQYCGDGSPTNMPKPVFTIPYPMISKPACRIMSLKEPTKKMSKSDPKPSSRILITDTNDEIRKKIKSALTDSLDPPISYQPESRPGVSNLIEILKHVRRSQDSCEEIAAQLQGTHLGAFKDLVATEIIAALDGVRDRYNGLVSGPEVELAMVEGAWRARSKAGKTMQEVERAVGLYGYRDVINVCDRAKAANTSKLRRQ